jgi:cell wall-associated NlpC family hydrolase
MNPYRTLVAALAGAAFLFYGVADMTAATKKKKKTSDDTSDDATPAPKHVSTPPLDLPLPAKTNGDGATGATTAKKKTDDSATPPPKSPEKPGAESKPKSEHAPNATIDPETIAEFVAQPPRIQQLIRDAIDLTRLNLTYTFGSADPDSGGMDCSGTIYYLLHAHKFNDAPRDSAGQYLWTRRGAGFFPVVSKSADSTEFKDLLPGDLMFWTGTYETGRDIPISHVMMYLGREKGTGKRIMFGASDGRSYNGIQRWGVSVFDFKMPKADPANPEKAKVEFVGFARIPGLRSPAPPLVVEQDASDGGKKGASGTDDKPSAASTPAPNPTPKSSSSHKKKKKVSSD